MRRLTLGTLMMSALLLAGCGGGTGSLAPRTANQTTPGFAERHVKSYHDGLTAGDFTPLCGPVPRGRARCASYVLTPSGAAAAGLVRSTLARGAGLPPPGYGPADLQSAYGLTAAAKRNGADAIVAIVDAYDNPRAEQDLAVYRARYGLPPCTSAGACFRKVNQSGRPGPLPPPPPPDAAGWTVESSLDLDMVSANCPKCRIVLVESNDDFMDNLGAAVNAAAGMGADAISNSYVAQEWISDPMPVSQGGILPYYLHPGIAVVAATGDYGYALSGYAFGALVPAALPSVIAAGGTELVRDPASPRGWSETAWGGGGSGCSAYEPMPPWQTANPSCVGSLAAPSGATSSFASRIYADVAYVASAYTGVAVYNTNGQFGPDGWGVIGGTSVASPAIAAIYGLARGDTGGGGGTGARAAQQLGSFAGAFDDGAFPARKLYASRNALFDITSGVNGTCAAAFLCSAGPGYDGPTGNGTPNGIAAFRD